MNNVTTLTDSELLQVDANLSEALSNIEAHPEYSLGDADYIWNSIFGENKLPESVPAGLAFPILLGSAPRPAVVTPVFSADTETWTEHIVTVNYIRVVSGMGADGELDSMDIITFESATEGIDESVEVFRRRTPGFTIDDQGHDKLAKELAELSFPLQADTKLGASMWHAEHDQLDDDKFLRLMMTTGGLWSLALASQYALGCILFEDDPLNHVKPRTKDISGVVRVTITPDNKFVAELKEGDEEATAAAAKFLKGPPEDPYTFDRLCDIVDELPEGATRDLDATPEREGPWTAFSWNGKLAEDKQSVEFDVEVRAAWALTVTTEDILMQMGEGLLSRSEEILEASTTDFREVAGAEDDAGNNEQPSADDTDPSA